MTDAPAPPPEYLGALLRHFADLRDGTHGSARTRREKEDVFAAAVPLLDPYARQVLAEVNAHLLLGTGEVTAAEVPTLRAITATDAHNLVFRRDYRIIPATTRGDHP